MNRLDIDRKKQYTELYVDRSQKGHPLIHSVLTESKGAEELLDALLELFHGEGSLSHDRPVS